MRSFIWLPIVALWACTSPTSTTNSTTVSYTMDSSTSTQVNEYANAGSTSVTLNLGLGTTAHDVFVAFTNPRTSASSKPTVSGSDGVAESKGLESGEPVADPSSVATNDLAFATRLPSVTRSAAQLAQGRALALSRSVSASASVQATSPDTTLGVGVATKTFRYETYDNTLSSTSFTLAAQVTNTAQNRIVNVWVAGSLYPSTVTQTMATALAAKFLVSGTDTGHDIYSWDTGIFGREYYEPGTSVASDLVTPTGVIDIVLADLNPNRANQSSYVYGYFWAVNDFATYVQGTTEYSNNSISFYLDAPLFAKLATGVTSWDISGTYPSAMVSTLAHEFQHMIQFYQKQLRQNLDSSTDSWINEMCSMVAEDLLADKMVVPGPRGVPLSGSAFDYSTGALVTNATSDRVAVFNRYYPTLPLTGSASYGVDDYAMAYSFGSWLARNYGGAALFRSLVQNSGTDYQAVVAAVNAVNGTSVTWAQLLRRWGASIAASSAVASAPYQLQTTSPYQFTSTVTSAVTGDALAFQLGSIDYSKYYAYGTKTAGPILSSSFSGLTSIPAAGLNLAKPLTSATGNHTLTLNLPTGVDFTVVTRISP